jgi:ADP-ribosylglycohydrolase
MNSDRQQCSLKRFQGALLGLAAGDAVGTTLEFKPPGTFQPISDMAGGGPFDLEAGQWTDDTSLALCLAASLTECRGFDPRDQMQRYFRWWTQGYMSSTGRCFDIGNTTRSALEAWAQTSRPFSGPTDAYSAGNGSIMRLAPAPLFFAANPELAVRQSGESSRTTHGARLCIDACRFMGGLLVGAVRGVDKNTLLESAYCPVLGLWDREPLHSEIAAISKGSYKQKQPPAIRGTGFVVASLEAALWAFWNSSDFREGCLKAVNLGDDADTTGAVYGQIAGAYYGVDGIPLEWRTKLAMRTTIEDLASRLHELSGLDNTMPS